MPAVDEALEEFSKALSTVAAFQADEAPEHPPLLGPCSFVLHSPPDAPDDVAAAPAWQRGVYELVCMAAAGLNCAGGEVWAANLGKRGASGAVSPQGRSGSERSGQAGSMRYGAGVRACMLEAILRRQEPAAAEAVVCDGPLLPDLLASVPSPPAPRALSANTLLGALLCGEASASVHGQGVRWFGPDEVAAAYAKLGLPPSDAEERYSAAAAFPLLAAQPAVWPAPEPLTPGAAARAAAGANASGTAVGPSESSVSFASSAQSAHSGSAPGGSSSGGAGGAPAKQHRVQIFALLFWSPAAALPETLVPGATALLTGISSLARKAVALALDDEATAGTWAVRSPRPPAAPRMRIEDTGAAPPPAAPQLSAAAAGAIALPFGVPDSRRESSREDFAVLPPGVERGRSDSTQMHASTLLAISLRKAAAAGGEGGGGAVAGVVSGARGVAGATPPDPTGAFSLLLAAVGDPQASGAAGSAARASATSVGGVSSSGGGARSPREQAGGGVVGTASAGHDEEMGREGGVEEEDDGDESDEVGLRRTESGLHILAGVINKSAPQHERQPPSPLPPPPPAPYLRAVGSRASLHDIVDAAVAAGAPGLGRRLPLTPTSAVVGRLSGRERMSASWAPRVAAAAELHPPPPVYDGAAEAGGAAGVGRPEDAAQQAVGAAIGKRRRTPSHHYRASEYFDGEEEGALAESSSPRAAASGGARSRRRASGRVPAYPVSDFVVGEEALSRAAGGQELRDGGDGGDDDDEDESGGMLDGGDADSDLYDEPRGFASRRGAGARRGGGRGGHGSGRPRSGSGAHDAADDDDDEDDDAQAGARVASGVMTAAGLPTVSAKALARVKGRSRAAPPKLTVALRRGKWPAEEEAFTSALVQAFQDGFLPLDDGVTLRTLLSGQLHCAPMRITKKFAKNDSLGKQVYRRRTDVPAGAWAATSAAAVQSLEELREAFFKATLEKQGVDLSLVAPDLFPGAGGGGAGGGGAGQRHQQVRGGRAYCGGGEERSGAVSPARARGCGPPAPHTRICPSRPTTAVRGPGRRRRGGGRRRRRGGGRGGRRRPARGEPHRAALLGRPARGG